MFEKIRNKYLYDKTQIIEINPSGTIVASDNNLFNLMPQTSVFDFHPFFETLPFLFDKKNKEYTFTCIHLDFENLKKTVDVVLNTGSETQNPILILYDFTEHYNNFQSISQEKNESVLNFHLEELKTRQLQSEKEFKNKFLANIGHDLKTPINASHWFINLLEKSNLTDNQKEKLSLLKETNLLIKGLIDDLLDLSKIELGKMDLVMESFDFNDFIKHIMHIISAKAQQKNLLFNVDVKTMPKTIVSDKTRLAQVLINLLDNAIKFTPKGSITLKIDVIKKEDNIDFIEFQVIDTGLGIKASNKNDIYQSFKKLHAVKEIEGSGLGLSIVSNLITLMNGCINYETEVGKGTTFIIHLPLQIA